jgi:predicted ATP-dependent endonuclease of OLD family
MASAMSEGFFADAVVLVEGEDDRAALLGTASFLGHDLERAGLSIITCGGKTCLDRPFVVFTKLGIPVYLVWDGDKGGENANPADNHRLLRLLGEPVTDWPAAVTERYSCFECDLETTMQAEIGSPVYDALLTACQSHFQIPKRKHARKNPSVIAKIIEDANRQGIRCASLEAVVAQLRAFH